jgi:hypothetical protein
MMRKKAVHSQCDAAQHDVQMTPEAGPKRVHQQADIRRILRMKSAKYAKARIHTASGLISQFCVPL